MTRRKRPRPTSTERVRALENRIKAEGGAILRLRLGADLTGLLDWYTQPGESRTGAALRAIAQAVELGA